MPAGWRILDIGPKAIAAYQAVLSDAKTVVWNGPMGVFEMHNFAKGTLQIAESWPRYGQGRDDHHRRRRLGGGRAQAGLADRISHISTGGGASLEMLEGKELPGVVALQDK